MDFFPLLSVFFIGLSYGATACMLSCMPFLSPIILANSRKNEALKVVIPFTFGRITSYVFISIVAFSSSVLIKHILQNRELTNQIFGSFVLFTAVLLFYKAFKKSRCDTHQKRVANTGIFGLFGIGALLSLNPCIPVLSLISLSTNSESFLFSILLGLFFGLGATFVSFLFFGFFLSHITFEITKELGRHKFKIEIFAASLLLLSGFLVLGGFLQYD